MHELDMDMTMMLLRDAGHAMDAATRRNDVALARHLAELQHGLLDHYLTLFQAGYRPVQAIKPK